MSAAPSPQPTRATNLWQWVRRYPATAGFIALAVGLHLVKLHAIEFGWAGPLGAERQIGAVTQLRLKHSEAMPGTLATRVSGEEISGLIDLWEGEWWRMLCSPFIHAGLLHLGMNGLALATLGRLLEPRMGSWLFAIFFIIANVVSMIPEGLMDHAAIGMSGGLCALFGLLLPWRFHDEEIAAVVNERTIQSTMLILCGMIVATQLDLVNIANAAHFAGLAYGWMTGELFVGRWASRRVARVFFLIAHAALIPSFYALTHPWWSGNYHWYLAEMAPRDDIGTWTHELSEAIRRDPKLITPRNELALARAWFEEDRLGGCLIAVEGVARHRANDPGVAIARKLYAGLDETDRARVRKKIEEEFGAEAPEWIERFTLQQPMPPDMTATVRPSELLFKSPVLQLPGSLAEPAAPRFDPNDPESASEGRPL